MQQIVIQVNIDAETLKRALAALGPAPEVAEVKKPAKKEPKAKEVVETFGFAGEAEPPVVKEETKKALVLADVGEVLKVYAEKNGREKAIALLSQFKVKSIKDLKEPDYRKLYELASV